MRGIPLFSFVREGVGRRDFFFGQPSLGDFSKIFTDKIWDERMHFEDNEFGKPRSCGWFRDSCLFQLLLSRGSREKPFHVFASIYP